MSQECTGTRLVEMTKPNNKPLRVRHLLTWWAGRSGLPRHLLAFSLAIVSCSAAAQEYDSGSPCTETNPPDWCLDFEAALRIDREAIPQPESGLPGKSMRGSESSLVMVGSTVVAPPVLWIQGRPSNPGKVYVSGEVTDFVKALESILPADWTIWAPKNLAKLILAAGGQVVWDGNGREWPEVLEALARQYGMEITADIVIQRAVLRLPSPAIQLREEQVRWNGTGRELPTLIDTVTQPNGMEFTADMVNMHAVIDDRIPQPLSEKSNDPVEDDAREDSAMADENSVSEETDNLLYRQYVSPAQLSPEPLPDTIGRVAWRFVPLGVQIDLSALGAYVNSPIFQWDIHDLSVSPKAALEALLPTGYCLDESRFPTITVIVCGDDGGDSKTDSMIVDYHDDTTS